MSKKKSTVVYEVIMMRRDTPLVIMQSENFDECYERWKVLHSQWAEAIKEVKPFVLEDPILTAFEPGMIYEIILQPIQAAPSMNVNPNNPYYKNMMEHGLSKSLGNEDLLSKVNHY